MKGGIKIGEFKITDVAIEGYHVVDNNKYKILTIPYKQDNETDVCTLYVSRDFLDGLILLFNHSLSSNGNNGA